MKYLAALCTMGIFVAGNLYPVWWAAVAAGFLGGVLGLLFARAEQGSTIAVVESATEHPLELGSISEQPGVTKLSPVYVQYADGVIRPVHAAFVARLNCQHSIILETN